MTDWPIILLIEDFLFYFWCKNSRIELLERTMYKKYTQQRAGAN